MNEATTNLERARPPGPRYLVGRYHEIGLKGRNRWRFVDELKRNLQGLFADYRLGRMRGEGRRLMVELPDTMPDEVAQARAALAFGLQNFSLSRRVPLTMEAILDEALAAARRDRADARTFRVSTSRTEKRFPLDSMAIDRAVGAVIAADSGLRVDLETPDLVVAI